jgi:hypothetical protein
MNKTIEVTMSQEEKHEALNNIVKAFASSGLGVRPAIFVTGDISDAGISGLDDFIRLIKACPAKDDGLWIGDHFSGDFDILLRPYDAGNAEVLKGSCTTSTLFIVIEVAGADFNQGNRKALRIILDSRKNTDSHIIYICGDDCTYIGNGDEYVNVNVSELYEWFGVTVTDK